MNEDNSLESQTRFIRQHDKICFYSGKDQLGSIYRTNSNNENLDKLVEFRYPIENYFQNEFSQPGLFYYSFHLNSNEKSQMKKFSFKFFVLPEIRFHWKRIRLSDFDAQPILTNQYDFIIWHFEQTIRSNLIQLRPNETIEDLASCHNRATFFRNRQVLAVECISQGIFHFANPG